MEINPILRLAEAIMPNVTASMQKVQVRLDAVTVAVYAQLSKRDADEEIKSD